jgi:NAD(P)-dependent dehydrogenase (short-subunit alcohol dehydrogenase family)
MTEPRVAIITGAAGSLGRVLAQELASGGYELALLGTDRGRLEALPDELGLERSRTLTVAADLRDADAVNAAISAVYGRFGRVDALAHLVGGWTGGMHIGRSPDAPYAAMLDQHFWTTLNVVRELAPRMVDAGYGRIVAVTSPMAAAPDAGMSAYGVGKAAQEALLAALANEVAGTGVTVNVVRVRAIDPSGDADQPSTKEYATTAAEISVAIRYLFGPEARVVNGQRIGLHHGR